MIVAVCLVVCQMSKARGLFIENEYGKKLKKVWKVGLTRSLWKLEEGTFLILKVENAGSLAKGCQVGKWNKLSNHWQRKVHESFSDQGAMNFGFQVE